jgi:NADH-quinone oxidoreductase subunit C
VTNPLKSYAAYSAKSAPLLELLKSKFGGQLIDPRLDLGDAVVGIDRSLLLDFLKNLKEDPDLRFNMIIDITAVDWMDTKPDRFEVVYHLMSLPHLYRLRIKVAVPESDPSVDSCVSLWSGANFMERETWDMFGVVFKGNSDLRRLLMYDEFKGHPLRKDYPVQARQPRIPLRHPEVRNTAVDMVRPNLVQINRRRSEEKHPEEGERGQNRVLAASGNI